jgi:membrane associated rhomboid family serine protease
VAENCPDSPRKEPPVPLLTVIGLVSIIAVFAAFMGVLGGVSLWVALGDRADARRRRSAPAAPDVEYRKAA